MSVITRIRGLLATATQRPWTSAAQLPAGRKPIALVTTTPDSELATALVNSADAFLALHEAARAINARSVLGITYIRASERKALAAALTKLDT